jgi:hypothetical protein
VSRRPKRRGLAIFLVPEVKMTRVLPWRFRRASHPLVTRLTTVRLDDFGFGTLGALHKWWESVVMLHSSTSGTFGDSRFTVGLPGQLPIETTAVRRTGDGG